MTRVGDRPVVPGAGELSALARRVVCGAGCGGAGAGAGVMRLAIVDVCPVGAGGLFVLGRQRGGGCAEPGAAIPVRVPA